MNNVEIINLIKAHINRVMNDLEDCTSDDLGLIQGELRGYKRILNDMQRADIKTKMNEAGLTDREKYAVKSWIYETNDFPEFKPIMDPTRWEELIDLMDARIVYIKSNRAKNEGNQ